jgi:hypothetical protein
MIHDHFILQDTFTGYKKVIEFHDREGQFLWDIYNFYIREAFPTEKPRYYAITSPFDLTWKWAPQQALVFEDGKLIFSTDFSEAVKIRTGAMDTIFLQALGTDVLTDKKILIVGSGGTAKYSYIFLRDAFPSLWQVHYTNRTGVNKEFESLGELVYRASPDLGEYDMIFLHAHISEPYLREKDLKNLKPWVIITSYGGITPERDIESIFFDSAHQIFVDMTENIENLKPLKTALEKWQIRANEIIDLWSYLSGEIILPEHTGMKIFISGWTHIQNIAMMKYLMSE